MQKSSDLFFILFCNFAVRTRPTTQIVYTLTHLHTYTITQLHHYLGIQLILYFNKYLLQISPGLYQYYFPNCRHEALPSNALASFFISFTLPITTSSLCCVYDRLRPGAIGRLALMFSTPPPV